MSSGSERQKLFQVFNSLWRSAVDILAVFFLFKKEFIGVFEFPAAEI